MSDITLTREQVAGVFRTFIAQTDDFIQNDPVVLIGELLNPQGMADKIGAAKSTASDLSGGFAKLFGVDRRAFWQECVPVEIWEREKAALAAREGEAEEEFAESLDDLDSE